MSINKLASLHRFFIGYWINGAKFLLWPLFYGFHAKRLSRRSGNRICLK